MTFHGIFRIYINYYRSNITVKSPTLLVELNVHYHACLLNTSSLGLNNKICMGRIDKLTRTNYLTSESIIRNVCYLWNATRHLKHITFSYRRGIVICEWKFLLIGNKDHHHDIFHPIQLSTSRSVMPSCHRLQSNYRKLISSI